MDVVQEVEKGTRAPRLRVARVPTEFAILVRQLRKTRPRIILDVSSRRQQQAMQVVQSLRVIL